MPLLQLMCSLCTDSVFRHPCLLAMRQAEQGNNPIRCLDVNSGAVTTLAGGQGAGLSDGVGIAASFREPNGIAISSAGNRVLVVSWSAWRVWRGLP